MKKLIGILLGWVLLSQASYGQLDGTGIAPDFTLMDVSGNEHHLYEYLNEGKIVVLDFFAVWCSICQADASYLASVYEQFGPSGSGQVEMLSIEADDATTDLQTINYALNFGSKNPHINTSSLVPDFYAVQFFPTYYVVAPDRSYKIIGGRQETMEIEMIAAIESAPSLRTVENDIRLMSYQKPKESLCAPSFQPELRIQNYGSNRIDSCIIQVWIDDQLHSEYPYAGVLEPYFFDDLVLPEVSGVVSGWHRLEFKFAAVNGLSDGDPTNGGGGDFLILPEGIRIDVAILTDAYPRETSWAIYENGKQVIRKDGYTKGLMRDTSQVCVQEGSCYRLVLYDEYGDGMSSGGIQVLYGETQLSSIQAASFSGDSTWVDFCVEPGGSGRDDPEHPKTGSLVYPNPSTGEVSIRLENPSDEIYQMDVLDLTGRVVLSIITQQGQNYIAIDLSDSPGGLYFVRLKTTYGFQTHRILVKH